MDDLVVFCDRDSLEAGLLAEFIQNRRVPQNLFYLMNGADSFYSYRNLEVDQIPWREEYEFFIRQSLWTKSQSIGFISLGCGNARPEKQLLRHLHLDGFDISYLGVDSSDAMLALAEATLAEERFPKSFVLADFGGPEFPSDLGRLTHRFDSRIYAMIGATFGNFDQAYVADLLGRLVSVNDFTLSRRRSYVPGRGTEWPVAGQVVALAHNLSRFFDQLPYSGLGCRLSKGASCVSRAATVDSVRCASRSTSRSCRA